MKYKHLKQKHDALEQEVIDALKKEIANSKIKSIHVDAKCIKVNVFDYIELVNLDDELLFMDENGYMYSLYNECSLEDLIDILTQIK